MVTKTQLDTAVSTAVAAALEGAQAQFAAMLAALPQAKQYKVEDSGAVWFSKPTEKHPDPDWEMDGKFHATCPHCNADGEHKVFMYIAGGDGETNNKPVYRLSICRVVAPTN